MALKHTDPIDEPEQLSNLVPHVVDLHRALVEERNVLIDQLVKTYAACESWSAYELEAETIIAAFVEWANGDLLNEMSPLAERLRGLLAARTDRGVRYPQLSYPTAGRRR